MHFYHYEMQSKQFCHGSVVMCRILPVPIPHPDIATGYLTY